MATAQKSEVKLVHMADNGENETVVQNRDESKHYSLTTGKKKIPKCYYNLLHNNILFSVAISELE